MVLPSKDIHKDELKEIFNFLKVSINHHTVGKD
jgi:hypothetical protein